MYHIKRNSNAASCSFPLLWCILHTWMLLCRCWFTGCFSRNFASKSGLPPTPTYPPEPTPHTFLDDIGVHATSFQFFKSHLCLSWLHSHGFFIWLNYSSCQYKVELWQQTFVMPQLQSLAYGGKRFHYRNKVLWMQFRCDSLFVDLMEFSCNPQKDKVNMIASGISI